MALCVPAKANLALTVWHACRTLAPGLPPHPKLNSRCKQDLSTWALALALALPACSTQGAGRVSNLAHLGTGLSKTHIWAELQHGSIQGLHCTCTQCRRLSWPCSRDPKLLH